MGWVYYLVRVEKGGLWVELVRLIFLGDSTEIIHYVFLSFSPQGLQYYALLNLNMKK